MSGREDQRGIGETHEVRVVPPGVTRPAPASRLDSQSPSWGRRELTLSPECLMLANAFEAALGRSIVYSERVASQDIPFRGIPFEKQGRLILPTPKPVPTTASNAANAVSNVDGATYTEANGSTQAVASFTCPTGNVAIIDDVAWRVESEIGYAFVQATLQLSGTPAQSVQALALPFGRDDRVRVRRIVKPGQTVNLNLQNTDTECWHLVEASMRGWYFPVELLSDSLRGLITNASSL